METTTRKRKSCFLCKKKVYIDTMSIIIFETPYCDLSYQICDKCRLKQFNNFKKN